MVFGLIVIGSVHAATYVYDANGRLRAVTNTGNVSGRYVYDVMGNLLRVDQIPSGQLAIFAFSPGHGAPGTGVVISGQGFSTTVANDTVTFNGVVTAVTAATATQLTVTVPAGATTGKISVTVSAVTVTSDDTFVVDNTGFVPIVTSFTPTIGGIGVPVTVTGLHFDPVPNQTWAAINSSKTTPTSVNDTQVAFVVASNLGSGKVSITTPYGMGISTADFYVTPPGISVASVAIQKRIAVGGSTPLNIPAGNYAAVLFDATAGSWLSFQASSITSSASNIAYTIYNEQNVPIFNGKISTSNASIHLPSMPVSGTYSIWIQPDTAAASLTLALEADKALPLNAPLSISTAGPGQSKRVTFAGTLNQILALQVATQTTAPAAGTVQYAVYSPTGVQYQSLSTTSPVLSNMTNLPATGTYAVYVVPNGSATLNAQLELWSEVTETLTVNGPSQNVAPAAPGENAYLNFTATPGESVGLGISGLTESPDSSVYILVYDANNNFVTRVTCSAVAGGCGWDPQNLVGGNYQIIVEPPGYDTVSFTATLSQNLSGTLTPNTVATTTLNYGQTETLTFAGSAGQTLALEASNVTTVPAGGGVIYNLYEPNGNGYTYMSTSTTGYVLLNLPSLPQTGTYTVSVAPNYGASINGQLELLLPVIPTLTVGGPSQNIASTTPGENVYLNFSATAGQSAELAITGLSESPDYYVSVYVYDANKNFIDSATCYATGSPCALTMNLAGGNYQAIVEPPGNDTMSFTAVLTPQ
jgi:YD repeat-containing protein